MTLGSGRALALLSAKQLSHGGQGSLPEFGHGDQPKDNCYKFHPESEDRDVSKTHCLAGQQHTQDRVRQERGELKRPNLFKAGVEGHLEDISVED